MEFEIGIACGTCDTYNSMGTEACVGCGASLSLFTNESHHSQPRFRAVSPTGEPHPPTPAPPVARTTGTSRQTTAPAASMSAMLSETAAPAVPRRSSDPKQPAIDAPALSARGGAFTRRPPAPDLSLAAPDAEIVHPSISLGVAQQGAAPVRETEPRIRVVPPASPAVLSSIAPRKQPPSYAHLTREELMDQARHYLCWQCYTPVPSGHKFCGRCGAEVPAEILNARTVYFSDMQNPAKARLVLIRGEGMDGLSYHLKMEQHVVGKKGQIPFPDDPYVSPKHANLFYRDGKLIVRDEGSLNGVYLRVRGSIEVLPGDTFLAGEQVFRFDAAPKIVDPPDAEGTYFYTSPKYPSAFRITQILQGGATGMTVCARGNALQLGRENSDLNFPADIYMSGSHCRIEDSAGRFVLTDLSSRNGTYVRLKAEREVGHGDYLFIGRKLMRVELNA